jgi:hypothetical protein
MGRVGTKGGRGENKGSNSFLLPIILV